MDNIEQIVINNFKNNLEFLKDYDNKLYQRIIVLNDLIQTNQYIPRYELEYIQDDKEFDIFDIKEKKYLYNKKPSLFIKDNLKFSDFDKLNTIDLLEPHIYNIKQSTNNKSKIDNILLNDIFEYTKIFQKSTISEDKKFKYIDKFIFIGTLLGTHIEKVDEKLNSKFYFIYESNLEIFRLSLFTTDYLKLANNSKLLFSIMDDDILLDKKLIFFFNQYQRANYMIKYNTTNCYINNIFDKLFSISFMLNPFSYTYPQILNHLISSSLKQIPKYNILNTSKRHLLLSNKKILFLAAGPSLEKNIEWIKKNKNNFFIIAIGATIKTISKYQIIPNLIVSIDSQELVINQFPKNTHKDIKKVPFLASISTHQSVLNIFKNVTLFEVMSRFKEMSLLISGKSVGEISLYLISILGAKEIYMLGTDMALDQETGATHTGDHNYNKIYDISLKKIKENSFMENNKYNKQNILFKVKGNLRDSVVTTATMQKSIYNYDLIIDKIIKNNKGIKIYNLCDGAYLKGTISTDILSLKEDTFIEQKYKKKDTIKYLYYASSSGFTKKEKNILKLSIEIVDKLIKELKRINKTNIKTYNEFETERLSSLNIISIDMEIFENLYLNQLFIIYYLTMEQYIAYNFNDKDLKDESSLVKEVKKVWCNQILRLAYEYKKLVLKVDLNG